MVDGINGSYGGGYIGGFYGAPNNGNVPQEEDQQAAVVHNNYNETQVDPSKVMEFLANHNYFIKTNNAAEVAGVDPALKDRVSGYMEQFEMIYGIVLEEFGEELAPAVMDVVMDSLIGMAE